jgi:hypothetical protein
MPEYNCLLHLYPSVNKQISNSFCAFVITFHFKRQMPHQLPPGWSGRSCGTHGETVDLESLPLLTLDQDQFVRCRDLIAISPSAPSRRTPPGAVRNRPITPRTQCFTRTLAFDLGAFSAPVSGMHAWMPPFIRFRNHRRAGLLYRPPPSP